MRGAGCVGEVVDVVVVVVTADACEVEAGWDVSSWFSGCGLIIVVVVGGGDWKGGRSG